MLFISILSARLVLHFIYSTHGHALTNTCIYIYIYIYTHILQLTIYRYTWLCICILINSQWNTNCQILYDFQVVMSFNMHYTFHIKVFNQVQLYIKCKMLWPYEANTMVLAIIYIVVRKFFVWNHFVVKNIREKNFVVSQYSQKIFQ